MTITGDKIKSAIDILGLTVPEVALRIGVSLTTVRNWTKGTHPISARYFRKVKKLIAEADACDQAIEGEISANAASLMEMYRTPGDKLRIHCVTCGSELGVLDLERIISAHPDKFSHLFKVK